MDGIDKFYKILARNIKIIRMSNGDTQEQLAEKINMSRGFLSQVESPNMVVGVSLDTLFKMSKLYGVEIESFFKGTKDLFINNDSKN